MLASDHENMGPMNTPTPICRGLGITAGLDAGLARDLAVRCEHLGYHSLWSNDEPAFPGLETLAHFAAAASSSGLAWGPFPSTDISRCGSRRRSTASGSIPRSSGSGSGLASCARRSRSSSGPSANCVNSSRRNSHRRRSHATAAVPPRRRDRRRRAAQLDAARPSGEARRWVHEGADKAGRAAPVVASYVRVAVGSGSRQRLRDEEGYYRNINEDHRQHFEAMDVPLGSVGVAASARPEVLEGLALYHSALDLPIVRVLAEQSATSLRSVAIAAAP